MNNLMINHPSFIHLQDINDLCSPLAEFNISTFANARVNVNGEFSSLNNNPEFMQHYLEKGYHCADISAKKKYLMGAVILCGILPSAKVTQKIC